MLFQNLPTFSVGSGQLRSVKMMDGKIVDAPDRGLARVHLELCRARHPLLHRSGMPVGVAATLGFDVETVPADQGKSHMPVPRTENAGIEHSPHRVERLPSPSPGAPGGPRREPEAELVVVRAGKAVCLLMGAALQPIGAERFEVVLARKVPGHGRIHAEML